MLVAHLADWKDEKRAYQ
jgi:hypothetical protein